MAPQGAALRLGQQEKLGVFSDVKKILAALDQAMSVGAAISGKVRMIGQGGTALDLVASRGLSESFQRDFSSVRRSDRTPSALASKMGSRVIVSNVETDPRAALYGEAGPKEGFHAMQATPIRSGAGNVIGTLSTHFAGSPHLSSAECVLLDHVAAKLGLVLESKLKHH